MLFVVVITLGGKKVVFHLRRKPEQELKAGTLGLELIQRPQRNAAYWLASILKVSYLSYSTQEYLP